MSAKVGGGIIDSNPRLRSAVLAAKKASMPSDNIDRAIKRGTGELEGVTYEEVVVRGLRPGRRRDPHRGDDGQQEPHGRRNPPPPHEVRRQHGRRRTPSAFQFSKKGYIAVEKSAAKEDVLMELALESGAEDFKTDDADVFEIITDPASFEAVKAAVEAKKIAIQTAEIQMVPQSTIAVADKSPALVKLLEMVEDNEDVQKVWSNGDIDEKYLTEE